MKGRDDRWALSYAEPWVADAQSYPLSPALPLVRPAADYASASIKRFIEHLLPEGRALGRGSDVQRPGQDQCLWPDLGPWRRNRRRSALFPATQTRRRSSTGEPVLREIPLQELDQRIAEREHVPLTVWDGKVRMSVAGLQDKLLVYLDRPMAELGRDGGRLLLVDGQRLASTHILKPDTGNPQTPHLTVNEHFCMSLARRMKLPAAEVGLLRTPRPVLVVRRFDRAGATTLAASRGFSRRHIIDACPSLRPARGLQVRAQPGQHAEAVRHIRDGLSFERLFGCADLTANKAASAADHAALGALPVFDWQ